MATVDLLKYVQYGVNGSIPTVIDPAQDSIKILSLELTETTNAPMTVSSTVLVSNLNADMVDGANVGSTDADLWLGQTIKNYVDGLVNGASWQEPVLKIETDSNNIISPAAGDRYLINGTGSGDFTGYDNAIAEYDGSAWTFTAATEGMAVFVEDINRAYNFHDGSWVVFASIVDHNALNTLQGGATGEYYHLTQAEHDGLTGGAETTLHTHNTDDIIEGSTNKFYHSDVAKDDVLQSIINSDSITWTYDSTNKQLVGVVKISGVNTAAELTVDATNGLTVNVKYDDVTVGVNANNELEIKDSAITAAKIADNVDVSTKGFNADMVDGANVGTTDTDLWLGSTIQDYVDTSIENSGFQRKPVLDVLNTPPATPNVDDRYLIDDGATGDWTGHDGEIAEYTSSGWVYNIPQAGWQVKVLSSSSYSPDEIFYFNGTEWGASIQPIADEIATNKTAHIQREVIGVLDAAPASPTTGDRYIVGQVTDTNDSWYGHDLQIAEWNGSAWEFTTITKGTLVKLSISGEDAEKYEILYFDGTTYISVFDEHFRKQLYTIKPVIDVVDDAPTTPSEGDRYIVSETPTVGGAFDGHANEIAEYVDGAWVFDNNEDPNVGSQKPYTIALVINQGRQFFFTGSKWIGAEGEISPDEANVLTGGRLSNAVELHGHFNIGFSGEALNVGELVLPKTGDSSTDPTAGQYVKASTNPNAGNLNFIGIALDSATGAGTQINVMSIDNGFIICSQFSNGGWSNITTADMGKTVYLDYQNPGNVSLTPPPTGSGQAAVVVGVVQQIPDENGTSQLGVVLSSRAIVIM